jgi:Protein of unknown function (DUF3303)
VVCYRDESFCGDRRRAVASFAPINPKTICVIGVICGSIAREAQRDASHPPSRAGQTLGLSCSRQLLLTPVNNQSKDILMKFMITWKASPAQYKMAVERFLKTGGAAPKGLKTLGRWHSAGSSRGFHLVEGSEVALGELNATWADLLELEAVPVVEDDVAGQVAAKIYGKK